MAWNLVYECAVERITACTIFSYHWHCVSLTVCYIDLQNTFHILGSSHESQETGDDQLTHWLSHRAWAAVVQLGIFHIRHTQVITEKPHFQYNGTVVLPSLSLVKGSLVW